MTKLRRNHLRNMENMIKTKKNSNHSQQSYYVFSEDFQMNHEEKAKKGEKILKEKVYARL